MDYNDTAATIAQFNVKAVLLPGDDRFTVGEPFHIGDATKSGVRLINFVFVILLTPFRRRLILDLTLNFAAVITLMLFNCTAMTTICTAAR